MLTYISCKKVIESGNYIKEDMLQKLDVFLLKNRITTEQYEELVGMMNQEQKSEVKVMDYFYYAEINEEGICINVIDLDYESSEPNYILVGTGSEAPAGFWNLYGKRYNAETGQFENVAYYHYASLDENGIVVSVFESQDGTLANNNTILLDWFNTSLNGQVYRNGKFMPVTVRTMLLVEEMYAMQTN